MPRQPLLSRRHGKAEDHENSWGIPSTKHSKVAAAAVFTEKNIYVDIVFTGCEEAFLQVRELKLPRIGANLGAASIMS